MSVLYFFTMFVTFFPTLAPHARAGEGTGTALVPSARTGVVEVV
jgi:hypothetical protein